MQRLKDFLSLEDGTDTLSRRVSKGLPLDAALTPQKRADLINIAAEAWKYEHIILSEDHFYVHGKSITVTQGAKIVGLSGGG
jgi:hypothetical protein